MEELPYERDRTARTKNPILTFVLDGVRFAVEQNQMDWAQAREKVLLWFPDAEIILEDEQQAGDDGKTPIST